MLNSHSCKFWSTFDFKKMYSQPYFRVVLHHEQDFLGHFDHVSFARVFSHSNIFLKTSLFKKNVGEDKEGQISSK